MGKRQGAFSISDSPLWPGPGSSLLPPARNLRPTCVLQRPHPWHWPPWTSSPASRICPTSIPHQSCHPWGLSRPCVLDSQTPLPPLPTTSPGLPMSQNFSTPKATSSEGFPGSLLVRTPCLHCRGHILQLPLSCHTPDQHRALCPWQLFPHFITTPQLLLFSPVCQLS